MKTDIIKLQERAGQYKDAAAKTTKRIILCAGTGCVANGSLKIRDRLLEILEKSSVKACVELTADNCDGTVHISKSGCQGFCQRGPLVRIEPDGILYTNVKPEDAEEIVGETITGGKVIERLLYKDPVNGKIYRGDDEMPFYARQKRLVLKNCTIDPECINEYIYKDGYKAAAKACLEMTPQQICAEIEKSGLRGRGGGGFRQD